MEMNRPARRRTPRAPDDDRAFDDPADLARPDETRDPAVANSENDEDPHDLEGQDLDQHIDVGGEVSLRGSDNTWARVEEIPDDIAALRKTTPNRPLKKMTMTNRSLDNNSTREVDMLEGLLPCSIEFMLEVVQHRASVVTPQPDTSRAPWFT